LNLKTVKLVYKEMKESCEWSCFGHFDQKF
jgi:hypothetical protein